MIINSMNSMSVKVKTVLVALSIIFSPSFLNSAKAGHETIDRSPFFWSNIRTRADAEDILRTHLTDKKVQGTVCLFWYTPQTGYIASAGSSNPNGGITLEHLPYAEENLVYVLENAVRNQVTLSIQVNHSHARVFPATPLKAPSSPAIISPAQKILLNLPPLSPAAALHGRGLEFRSSNYFWGNITTDEAHSILRNFLSRNEVIVGTAIWLARHDAIEGDIASIGIKKDTGIELYENPSHLDSHLHEAENNQGKAIFEIEIPMVEGSAGSVIGEFYATALRRDSNLLPRPDSIPGLSPAGAAREAAEAVASPRVDVLERSSYFHGNLADSQEAQNFINGQAQLGALPGGYQAYAVIRYSVHRGGYYFSVLRRGDSNDFLSIPTPAFIALEKIVEFFQTGSTTLYREDIGTIERVALLENPAPAVRIPEIESSRYFYGDMSGSEAESYLSSYFIQNRHALRVGGADGSDGSSNDSHNSYAYGLIRYSQNKGRYIISVIKDNRVNHIPTDVIAITGYFFSRPGQSPVCKSGCESRFKGKGSTPVYTWKLEERFRDVILVEQKR